METYPPPIQHYFGHCLHDGRSPGYLYVNQDYYILDAGGDLDHYGLHVYKKGQCIKALVCFLHGLLPLDGVPLVIPFIQFHAKTFADLHLLPGVLGDWVLLLDATEEAIQRQRAQQLTYQQ